MISYLWVYCIVASIFAFGSVYFAYRYLKDDPGAAKDTAGASAVVFAAVAIVTMGIIMEIL